MVQFYLSGKVENSPYTDLFQSSLPGDNVTEFQPEAIRLTDTSVARTIQISRRGTNKAVEMVHFCEIKIYGGKYSLLKQC